MDIKMSVKIDIVDLPKSESDSIIKVISYVGGILNNPQVHQVSFSTTNMKHKTISRIGRFFSEDYHVVNQFNEVIVERKEERIYEPKRIGEILNEIRQTKRI